MWPNRFRGGCRAPGAWLVQLSQERCLMKEIIKGRGFGVGAPLPELCSPRCPHFKEALPADITGTNIASATIPPIEAGGAEAQLRSGWQQVINGN